PYSYYLLNAIIHGKREIVVSGTPKSYIKIFTDDDLIIYYANLYDKTTKELNIISSIITTLNQEFDNDNLPKNQTNAPNLANSLPIIADSFSWNQNFLYNLNQLFISQFNIQTASELTTNSIIHSVKKYIDDNNKNPDEILKQYYNHQCRYYYTSIIGFFYEYGIGTIVDYDTAFNMYNQAAEGFYLPNINFCLLKDNQLIGLISLGLLYISGKGVMVNQPKALQLFIKSVAKGSSLGKFYIGKCYDCGYGVTKNSKHSFNWYVQSAKDGNAGAENIIGYCYNMGKRISKDHNEASKWFTKSAIKGNNLAYNNLGYNYEL
ncbi:5311_t:CDS:2, partial [Racocetra persica]